MNKYLSLIKTDLNSTFGLTSIIFTLTKSKRKWTYILISMALLSLIPSYIYFVKGLEILYESFRMIGQPSYFVLLGILGTQLIIFVLGILQTMGKYYFSKDLEQLVPLPVTASQIIGAKLTSLSISEYLVSIPMSMPFIIIYGIGEYVGPIYWVIALIVSIVLPFFPLSLASGIILVFMRYTNIKGRRDLIRIISGTVFMVVVVFLQIKLNNALSQDLFNDRNFMFNLARDTQLLVRKIGMINPPAMWGTLALTSVKFATVIFNLSLYLIITFVIVATVMFLSEKLYLKGLIGNSETSSSNKSISLNENSNNIFRIRKQYTSLAIKELKMLFKTPIYLMNSVGGVIIIPIIIASSFFTGGNDLQSIKNVIQTDSIYVILFGSAAIVFLGMVNSVGVTTFSREGPNLWIQQTMPITASNQVIGRLLASVFIQLLGTIFVVGSFLFIIPLPIITVILIIILGLLGSVEMTLIGMTIDIIRPMRGWTNPQQAMKQNLNVLIGMAISSLYLGALGFLSYKLIPIINHNFLLTGIALVFMVTITVNYIILKNLIEKRLRDIEE